ncbi:unnamed protein product [Sphagnum balticum]
MSTPSVLFVQCRPFWRDSVLKNVLLQSEVMLGWQRYGSDLMSFRIAQWSGGKVSCQCSSMLSSDLLLFCAAASVMLFTQHFQDKEYVSALWKFVLRRLALPSFHNSLPSVLNPQNSLLEYMKYMRGLQWFQWVGFGCILLGLD